MKGRDADLRNKNKCRVFGIVIRHNVADAKGSRKKVRKMLTKIRKKVISWLREKQRDALACQTIKP